MPGTRIYPTRSGTANKERLPATERAMPAKTVFPNAGLVAMAHSTPLSLQDIAGNLSA